ncbi:MAG: tRNA lysidine(34) synthetase TilS, partial [Lentisphaeria bacterium]|nr:tRNA lysidine(34) synthetase TilS [Lentisphaeria bacterium]
WLQAQTGTDIIPSREGVHRLREAAARFRTGSTLVPLGSGVTVALTAKGIRLAREQEPLGERSWTWRRDAVLDLPETGAGFEAEPVADVRHAILDPDVACEIFRESALAATLHVRSWRPGDRLVPFGRHSAVKLQDLFTEAKVPRDRRRRVPLLLSGDTVIWVPGVRRAEFGRAARGEPAVRLRYRAALHGDGCGIPCRDE